MKKPAKKAAKKTVAKAVKKLVDMERKEHKGMMGKKGKC
jgi:hypothetical protein